jgi:hypothetical protein
MLKNVESVICCFPIGQSIKFGESTAGNMRFFVGGMGPSSLKQMYCTWPPNIK